MTKEEIENRITIYGLISRLMIIEAECSFLQTIDESEALLVLFPNYAKWSKRSELSCDRLIAEHLNVDYAHLFLMHLVPYESFYTRTDQMIESGGNNPVITLYNALDFRVELDRARIVSSDHIGVELEFMYMLCTALQKAYEAEDSEALIELFKVQHGFLKDHLLEWAPMFLINMKRESRTPLYHDGAELALEFLLSDFEYVTQQLSLLCGKE